MGWIRIIRGDYCRRNYRELRCWWSWVIGWGRCMMCSNISECIISCADWNDSILNSLMRIILTWCHHTILITATFQSTAGSTTWTSLESNHVPPNPTNLISLWIFTVKWAMLMSMPCWESWRGWRIGFWCWMRRRCVYYVLCIVVVGYWASELFCFDCKYYILLLAHSYVFCYWYCSDYAWSMNIYSLAFDLQATTH